MNLNKVEVLKAIMKLSFNWESEGVVNVGWLAKSMNSTPYYVRKRIKTLVDEGYLVYSVRSGGWCEESLVPDPPLKEYSLTAQARNTELFSEIRKRDEDALLKAFGINV